MHLYHNIEQSTPFSIMPSGPTKDYGRLPDGAHQVSVGGAQGWAEIGDSKDTV